MTEGHQGDGWTQSLERGDFVLGDEADLLTPFANQGELGFLRTAVACQIHRDSGGGEDELKAWVEDPDSAPAPPEPRVELAVADVLGMPLVMVNGERGHGIMCPRHTSVLNSMGGRYWDGPLNWLENGLRREIIRGSSN